MFQVVMHPTQASDNSEGFGTIFIIFITAILCAIIGMTICLTLMTAIVERISRFWHWYRGYQLLPQSPSYIPPNPPVSTA